MHTLNPILEMKDDENCSLLIKSSRNIFNKSFTNNFYKNIKEIKVNFNKEKQDKNIFAKGYPEDEIYNKIKKIQKWWKYIHKVILIQKSVRAFLEWKKIIKVVFFIKMMYKLLFKVFICKIKYLKFESKNKRNDHENNTKNNTIKKIKKYETSGIFNKIKKSKNKNLISNNSTRNNNILKKKIEVINKTRNEALKSFYTNSTLTSLNTININKENIKENTKYILLNNNDAFSTINKKNTVTKYKKITNNLTNKEKIKAYNNIFNIYNNVKKFYENKTKNNEINYSTTNNFFKKNKNLKIEKKNINNNINKNKKNKLNLKERITINKNNNINVNIHTNNNRIIKNAKNAQNKNSKNTVNNLLKLRAIFIFWKEYASKKIIIQKLKIMKLMSNDYSLFNSRIKENEHKKSLSITTKKINLSNSVISQRLINITPKKLNQEPNNKIAIKRNNVLINNYASKKAENGIKEKIISFKTLNSPLNYINNQTNFNSTLNIFHNKRQNSIYQSNNFNELFCQTESNMNYPYNHLRANSINVQKDIDIYSPQEKSSKEYIYKSKLNSPKIVYKKKFLIVKKMKSKYLNFDEERNLTMVDNNKDLNKLNNADLYKNIENKNINSIYGGRILDNSFGKKCNKIEEREICFTPNKCVLKNNKGINLNIIENYINKGIKRDEIENYNYNNNNYIDNVGIKAKKINFW